MQQFVGKNGPRTLLILTLTEPVGRDVKEFSLYETENEILLLPNMCFKVQSSFDAGNDLVMIQCVQTDSCVNLNKRYLSMYHTLLFLCEKHVHSEHVFI